MSMFSSDEVPTEDERLHDAIIGFTGCIGRALSDICSYGWTIGETYVPFDPDEDDTDPDGDPCDVACSQAWVRVMHITPKQNEASGFDGNSCAMVLNMQMEVGVLRCIELEEGGEAPTATQVMAAAMQSITDMHTVLNAAVNCDVWDAITVGEWFPMGPLGGQYGGQWTFTVELDSGITCDD